MESARLYSDAVGSSSTALVESKQGAGNPSGLAVRNFFTGMVNEVAQNPRIKWMRFKCMPDNLRMKYESEFLKSIIMGVGVTVKDESLVALIPMLKSIIQSKEKAGYIFEGTVQVTDGMAELNFMDMNTLYTMTQQQLETRTIELDKELEDLSYELNMSKEALRAMQLMLSEMKTKLTKMDEEIERWWSMSLQFKEQTPDQFDTSMQGLVKEEHYRALVLQRQRLADEIATGNFITEAQERRVQTMKDECFRIIGTQERISQILADQSSIGSKRRMVQDPSIPSRLVAALADEVKEVVPSVSTGLIASHSSPSSPKLSSVAVAVIDAAVGPDAAAEEKKELAQSVLYSSSSSAIVEEPVADAVLKRLRVDPEVVTQEIADKVNQAIEDARQAEEEEAAEEEEEEEAAGEEEEAVDEEEEEQEEPAANQRVMYDAFDFEQQFDLGATAIADDVRKRKIRDVDDAAEEEEEEPAAVEEEPEAVEEEPEAVEEPQEPQVAANPKATEKPQATEEEDDEEDEDYEDEGDDEEGDDEEEGDEEEEESEDERAERLAAEAFKKFQDGQFNAARKEMPKIPPATLAPVDKPPLDTRTVKPVTLIPAPSVPEKTVVLPTVSASSSSSSSSSASAVSSSSQSMPSPSRPAVGPVVQPITTVVTQPPPASLKNQVEKGTNLLAVKRKVPVLPLTNTTNATALVLPVSSSSPVKVTPIEIKNTVVVNPTQADVKLQQLAVAVAERSEVDLKSAVAPVSKNGGSTVSSTAKSGSVETVGVPASISPAQAAVSANVKLPDTKMTVVVQSSLTETGQAQTQALISQAEKEGDKRKEKEKAANAPAVEEKLAPQKAVSSSSAVAAKSSAEVKDPPVPDVPKGDAYGIYLGMESDGLSDPVPPVEPELIELRDSILLGEPKFARGELSKIVLESCNVAKSMLSKSKGCAYLFQEEIKMSSLRESQTMRDTSQRFYYEFDDDMEIYSKRPGLKSRVVPFTLVVKTSALNEDIRYYDNQEVENPDGMREENVFYRLPIPNGDSRAYGLVTAEVRADQPEEKKRAYLLDDFDQFYLVHGDPTRGIPDYHIKASFVNLWSTCMCRTDHFVFVGLSSIGAVAIFKLDQPNREAKILSVDIANVNYSVSHDLNLVSGVRESARDQVFPLSLDIDDVFACTMSAGTPNQYCLLFVRCKNRVRVFRIYDLKRIEDQEIEQPQSNDWSTVETGPSKHSGTTFKSSVVLVNDLLMENAGKRNIKKMFVPTFLKLGSEEPEGRNGPAKHAIATVYLSPHYFIGLDPKASATYLKLIRISVLGKPLPHQYYLQIDRLRTNKKEEPDWRYMDFKENVANIHLHEQEFVKYWMLAALAQGAIHQITTNHFDGLAPSFVRSIIMETMTSYFIQHNGLDKDKAKKEAELVLKLASVTEPEKNFPPFGPELVICSEIDNLQIPYDGFSYSKDGRTMAVHNNDQVMVFVAAARPNNNNYQPDDLSLARYQWVPYGMCVCSLIDAPQLADVMSAKQKLTNSLVEEIGHSEELKGLLVEREAVLKPLLDPIIASKPEYPNSLLDAKEKRSITAKFNRDKKSKIAELEKAHNGPILEFCKREAVRIYDSVRKLEYDLMSKKRDVETEPISFCFVRKDVVLAGRGNFLYVIEIQKHPLRKLVADDNTRTSIGEAVEHAARSAAKQASVNGAENQKRKCMEELLRTLATDEMKARAAESKISATLRIIDEETARLTEEYKKAEAEAKKKKKKSRKKNKTEDDEKKANGDEMPQEEKDKIFRKAHVHATHQAEQVYIDALNALVRQANLQPTPEMQKEAEEKAKLEAIKTEKRVYRESLEQFTAKLTRYHANEMQAEPPMHRVLTDLDHDVAEYEAEYIMYESVRVIKVLDFNRKVVGIDDRLFPVVTFLFELPANDQPPIQSESRRSEWPAEREPRYTYGDTFNFKDIVEEEKLAPATGTTRTEIYSSSRLPEVSSVARDCRLFSDAVNFAIKDTEEAENDKENKLTLEPKKAKGGKKKANEEEEEKKVAKPKKPSVYRPFSHDEKMVARYLAVERDSLLQAYNLGDPLSPHYGGYKTEPPARLLRYLSKFNYLAISEDIINRFISSMESSRAAARSLHVVLSNSSSADPKEFGASLAAEKDKVNNALERFRELLEEGGAERSRLSPLCALFALFKNVSFKNNLAFATSQLYRQYEALYDTSNVVDKDEEEELVAQEYLAVDELTEKKQRRVIETLLRKTILERAEVNEDTVNLAEYEEENEEEKEIIEELAKMKQEGFVDEERPTIKKVAADGTVIEGTTNSVQRRRVGKDADDTLMGEPGPGDFVIVDDIKIDLRTTGRGKREKANIDYKALAEELYGDEPDSDGEEEAGDAYMDEPDIEEDEQDDEIED